MNRRPETLFGGIMQRLSLSFFYDLGLALEPLKTLEADKPLMDHWSALYQAEDKLRTLLWTPWMHGAVHSSWHLGKALFDAVVALRTTQDLKTTFTYINQYELRTALLAFEPVVRADLNVADAYYVTPKGGYDTIALITNASVLFPPDLPVKVPSAIPEIHEAGKCLAFELCTAAGIHALRALELVLKAYYKVVTNGKPLPKNRNLGAYLKALDGIGDAKTLAVLTQIKDLHRNSLMHPEETLTKDEALGLFGIVQSAMGAMLKQIPSPPALPTLPSGGQPA